MACWYPAVSAPAAVEGKICAARYARENKIPYFGICLGMQIAVIEFARHIAGLEKANSTEFDMSTPHPVIYLMEEWFDDKSGTIEKRDVHSDKGGTMRLGAYPLQTGSRYGGLSCLRHRIHFRTPPPPLRIQQRLYGAAQTGRPQDLGPGPLRRTGGDRGDRGPSLVSGMSIPPGVQIPAHDPPIPFFAALSELP